MNRRSNKIKWSVISIMSAITLLIFFTPSLEGILDLYLEEELSDRTGENVTIAELDIKWLKRSIVFEGIQVQQIDGDPVVNISITTAKFQLPWQGSWIKHLHIENPTLWIYIDEDGVQSFRYRRKSEEPNNLSQFPWRSLEIYNGKLKVSSEKTNIEIMDIDLSGFDENYNLDVTGIHWEQKGKDLRISDIHWKDIELNPKRFFIPDLAIDVEDIHSTGFFGSEDMKNIYGAITSNIDLSLLLPEKSKEKMELHGFGQVVLNPGGSFASPRLQGSFRTEDFVMARKSRSGNWRSFPIGEMNGEWSWRDNHIHIDNLQLPYAEGEVELVLDVYPKDNHFRASGFGTGLKFVEFAKAMSLSNAPWVDYLLDLELNVQGTLKPFGFRGDLDVMANSLLVAGSSIEDPNTTPLLEVPYWAISGEMWLENQEFGIDGSNVQFPNSSGQCFAKVSWRDVPTLNSYWSFTTFDLSNLSPLGGARLKGKGHFYGQIEGPFTDLVASGNGQMYGFSASGFDFADAIKFSFKAPTLKDLQFEITDALLGRSELNGYVNFDLRQPLSMNAKIQSEKARAQDLMQVFFNLPGIDSDATGEVEVRGPMRDLEVVSTFSLRNADLWDELFPIGSADIIYKHGQLTVEQVSFERRNGHESVLYRGSILPNGETNFETRLANISLENLSSVRALGIPIGGNLNGRIVFKGDNGEMTPTGFIDLQNLRYDKQNLSNGEIRFFADRDQLQFRGELEDDGLSFTGLSGYSTKEPYQFSVDLTEFPLHILMPRTVNGDAINGEATGNIILSGSEDVFKVDARVERVFASWKDTKMWSDEPWRITWSEGELALDGLLLKDNHKTDVRISARTQSEKPMVLVKGVIDLSLLKSLTPGMTQSAGSAYIDINSAGRLRDAAKGKVLIQDGYFAGSWFPHPIEDVSAGLSISPNKIEFQDVSGRVGGGALDVGGEMLTDAFVPVGFDMNIDFTSGQLSLISDLPPIYGDAQMQFKGPIEHPILSGKVQIKDMQFIDRIDWEDWLLAFSDDNIDGEINDEVQEEYFSMDIDVTSDNRIRVRNNLGDLYASADLQMIGTLSNPGMRGNVRVEPGGRALLKERDFSLLRGELRFVDPYSFDPEVDISMTTTVRSLEQDIEIQYYVSGLYSNWITQTTSNPTMPQADINSLLLLGMTRDQLERFGGLSSALIVEGGDLIASKFGVVERFNQVSEGIFQGEILRFDRIDIISGASMSGGSSMSSSLRLLAEKDLSSDSTLSVEQSFNRSGDVYVSFEQRLAERLVSEVFWGTEQKGRYLNIGGAYGASLRLRWEFE